MKVKFIDGTEETFHEEEYEDDGNFLMLTGRDENIIAQIAISQIKYFIL